MITYKCCKDVNFDNIYSAFQIGFSDYIIKIEMSKEMFLDRFFGPEGNQLENSFIAYDNELPIGLILGGIKDYENVKTIRCGTLCIHPDYRGKGVSTKLFELHKQAGIANDCKQLYLEVIVGNDRAINFYKKLGYEKIYDISYYSYEKSTDSKTNNVIELTKLNFNDIKSLSNQVNGLHINWQNDFDYMSKLEDLNHYGIYNGCELIGALSMSNGGKIFFIWTNPLIRHNGYALDMINIALTELNLSKANISFSNNTSLLGFVKHNNFNKQEISQYEMYLYL